MTSATNRSRFFICGGVVLTTFICSLFPGASAARGDDHTGGISVTGTGVVKGKPSVVEFDARVAGEGELANDASVKYRDMKKKVVAAFDALKNPDLSIEFKGSSVTEAIDPQVQVRMMQGAAADTAAPKVRVSEELHITLRGIDKLDSDDLLKSVTTIIDTCRDAGIQIGPAGPSNYIQAQIEAQQGGGDSAIAQFKIPDITALKEQAYKLAIDDARANAQRLADLSGVKLGPVISIQDEGATPTPANNNVFAMIMMAEEGGSPTAPQGDSKEVSSTNFGEIPVTVRLAVSFEIQK
jgi:uncharacterized protein YggE